MYHTALTTDQAAELTKRRRDPKTKPRTRERLEMIRLSHLGWSIPKIAKHFDLTESRVRYWVKTFLAQGFDALADRKGAGAKAKLTGAVVAQLRQVVGVVGEDGRTWTAGQVNEWLKEHHGFTLNPVILPIFPMPSRRAG